MIYLPDKWIINKENREKIHSLLINLHRDIAIEDDKAYDNVIKELKKMGETLIIEKIKDGTIMFGA